MRSAIQSTSASVTRTLEAIILASGHQLAKQKETPDLVIEDTLHPTATDVANAVKLTLVDKAASLEGAITCPLRPERLIKRLMMLGTTQAVSLGDGWTLDLLARTLQHTEGKSCSLTEKECGLLRYLAQSHPIPVSRDGLLEKVWGVAGSVDTHTLETHIYRLRAKLTDLSPHPCDIITVAGAYALVFGAESR